MSWILQWSGFLIENCITKKENNILGMWAKTQWGKKKRSDGQKWKLKVNKSRHCCSYKGNHKESWGSPWKLQLAQIHFHFPTLKLDSPLSRYKRITGPDPDRYHCTKKSKSRAIKPFMKVSDLVSHLPLKGEKA